MRTLLLLLALGTSAVHGADGSFETVYEPSGVTVLPDGQLIVVNDEAGTSLHRMRIETDGEALSLVEQSIVSAPESFTTRWRLGPLDDLEGACRDRHGRVFVTGSHNTKAGIDETDRRKLVRFRLNEDGMDEIVSRRDLREDLLDALPLIRQAMQEGGKHDEQLDIEGLACDRRRDRLLIGLRSPREGNRAIIVALTNPDAWLDEGDAPRFEQPIRTLDLDNGGIRAMGYDDGGDALLVVSRRESGKGGRYKAWWQDAAFQDDPVELTLPDKRALDDVEGVTVLDDPAGVLFVRDDGNRHKRRSGTWFFVTRDALGLAVLTPESTSETPR